MCGKVCVAIDLFSICCCVDQDMVVDGKIGQSSVQQACCWFHEVASECMAYTLDQSFLFTRPIYCCCTAATRTAGLWTPKT